MDKQQTARIEEFLSQNGLNIDTISNHKLNQFKKIDTIIQNYLLKILEAEDILKKTTINISSIADASGISRKTFYNSDQLLKKYVDSYNQKKSSNDVERILEENRLLKQQIQNFLLRDIESENLRQEIKSLQKELKTYETRNQSLEEENEMHIIAITKLKGKINNSSNVIKISDIQTKIENKDQ